MTDPISVLRNVPFVHIGQAIFFCFIHIDLNNTYVLFNGLNLGAIF